MKKALFFHLWPVLLLILLGISIFTPIYGDIGHRIMGSTTALNTQDGYQNIWNFWWAKKNCLGFCGNMWQTDYQFYPLGTSLLFETWSYPSLYLFTPLMFLGALPATVYNVALIFAVVTSLLAAYALVYHLTKQRTAAFVGAMIYGISPFVIGHVLDGQLNLVNVQYFPLFLLFLMKAREKTGKLFLILAGITLLLLGLNDYVFLLLAFMVWAIYMIYVYLTDWSGFGPFLKKSGMIFLIFIIPFVILSLANFRYFGLFNLSGRTRWNADYSSANLASFVTPPNYTLLGKYFFREAGKDLDGTYSDKAIYLGLATSALAAVGVFALKKKKELWLWISLGATSIVLALGPALHVAGKTWYYVWLPFKTVQMMPILNIIRAPSRFIVIVYLVLAILAGYGVSYIRERIVSKKVFAALFVILAITLLADTYPIDSPESDLYMPIGYKKIMEDKSDFAIIESPVLWMSGLENVSYYYPIETLYYQTIHEKKIANGYVTRVYNDRIESYADLPLVKYLINQSQNLPAPASFQSTLSRYTDLYAKNLLFENPYKYLVMKKDSVWRVNNEAVKNTLDGHLKKYYEDEEIEIYTFK